MVYSYKCVLTNGEMFSDEFDLTVADGLCKINAKRVEVSDYGSDKK